MSSEIGTNSPRPLPLKIFLVENSITQLELRDGLAEKLNNPKLCDVFVNRVVNGRRPVPKDWVLPVAEILEINVDEARDLLGLSEVPAEV